MLAGICAQGHKLAPCYFLLSTRVLSAFPGFPLELPPCLEAVGGRPPTEKTQGLMFWETSFTQVNFWTSSGWMLTQVAPHVLLQGGEERLSTNTSRPLKLPDWRDRFRVNPTQLTLQSPPGQAKLPSACTPPPVHPPASQISHREDAATESPF